MITEDEEIAVQGTASEALVSKHSAMRLGYYEDKFLPVFCRKKDRKQPIINRGYYARVECVQLVTKKFLKLTEYEERQILVIGGGYDTTCLKVLDEKTPNLNCFEVDFPDLIDRKAFLLMATAMTRQTLYGSEDLPAEVSTAASLMTSKKTNYGYMLNDKMTLISADLKDVATLLECLENSTFNFGVPTLLISECVLVYMDRSSVQSLSSGIRNRFEAESGTNAKALWLSYDMFNPEDRFGQIMRRNLRAGGIHVPGFEDYPKIEDQSQRFLSTGWQSTETISMLQAFRNMISAKERARIARVEIFDEIEEWEMIMQHYCLTLAKFGCSDIMDVLGTLHLNPSVRDGIEAETEDAEITDRNGGVVFGKAP